MSSPSLRQDNKEKVYIVQLLVIEYAPHTRNQMALNMKYSEFVSLFI